MYFCKLCCPTEGRLAIIVDVPATSSESFSRQGMQQQLIWEPCTPCSVTTAPFVLPTPSEQRLLPACDKFRGGLRKHVLHGHSLWVSHAKLPARMLKCYDTYVYLEYITIRMYICTLKLKKKNMCTVKMKSLQGVPMQQLGREGQSTALANQPIFLLPIIENKQKQCW